MRFQKGRIEDATFKILEQAWHLLVVADAHTGSGSVNPEIEVKILRPQEIPTYVQEGFYDVGITGKDWIKEAKADVQNFARFRIWTCKTGNSGSRKL